MTYGATLTQGIISAPHTTPQARTVHVGAEEGGQRLDNFLLRHLKGVPKTHIYRIIRSGEVRVNGGRASADARLGEGDAVRLPPLRLPAPKVVPAPTVPARAFPLLLEDDWLLALNKPSGVAVHGGSGVDHGVIEQLRAARPQAALLELVHRLDRETSGVLLVAKRRSALRALQQQFRERETAKIYLALVLGDWPARLKVLDQPLQKMLVPVAGGEAERRVRVAARGADDAQRAVTLVRVLQRLSPKPGLVRPLDALTLLQVRIQTGRTHQIRVHLASAGHPIAGDDKYGDFAANKALAQGALGTPLRRMFLHAWQLRCQHPHSGEALSLQAEPDAALLAVLQACGGHAPTYEEPHATL
jgi:23S rRNA pseudouridine955/2504/2580 synthase